MIELSVIIPTYNRRDFLLKCLNCLSKQTLPQDRYELILVDDGSTDGTSESISSLADNTSAQIQYLKQKHLGPATARNLGIKKSNGRSLLFIGNQIKENTKNMQYSYYLQLKIY